MNDLETEQLGKIPKEDMEFVAPRTGSEAEAQSIFETDPELVQIRESIDAVTDKLGYPIEPGIKDTVVIANALGLKTSDSCEGHLDRAGNAPYFEVYPTEPEVDDWVEDEQLRAPVVEESNQFRNQLQGYLTEFNDGRETDDEYRLGLSQIAYGWRVQPNGIKYLEENPDEVRTPERLERFRQEMRDFTDFMARKYAENKSGQTA